MNLGSLLVKLTPIFKMFVRALFLVMSGLWLGRFVLFAAGAYFPSNVDIGFAMIFTAFLYFGLSLGYREKSKAKRKEKEL